MKAIIPVAGYATRLHPLTKNKPKALIDVKGKPILSHIVDKISVLPDVDEIFVVTNSKFFYNFEDWAKESESDVPIKVINDNTESNDDRLGQMGDIGLALEKEKVDDDVLVISGDNLFSLALGEMHAEFKQRNAPLILLYDVKDAEEAKKLGVVEIGADKKVTSFEEKPAQPKSTLCSCGIYFFPRETVPLIAKYLVAGNDPDRMGNFLEWLIKELDVYGYTFNGKWFDIGSFESLGKAREEFEP
ncbi:MAG: nucleotidyltransferase family protein [Candidatus Diapherotrites archaeon]|nr:nucleotidyltransferase family protein [Candidatus Micrarchaeota archaeon]MBU1939794.1 nucleotidyltransferase family protein [Candidatus Micrarchaeota archaeon]